MQTLLNSIRNKFVVMHIDSCNALCCIVLVNIRKVLYIFKMLELLNVVWTVHACFKHSKLWVALQIILHNVEIVIHC